MNKLNQTVRHLMSQHLEAVSLLARIALANEKKCWEDKKKYSRDYADLMVEMTVPHLNRAHFEVLSDEGENNAFAIGDITIIKAN